MRPRTLFLLALILVATFSTPLFATDNQEEIELGFQIEMGTYAVPVEISGIGTEYLTFDTGASYTVLDRETLSPLDLKSDERVNVYLSHEGKLLPAVFVVLPEKKIGKCVLRNRRVIVMDIPKKRHGVLGMNDLEALAPFTFTSNGQLVISCTQK